MDDEISFVDELPEPDRVQGSKEVWYLMVVDDDHSVHEVTNVVTSDFSFDGRPLSLINCYSAAEAYKVLKQRRDVAVILLDVVMETDTAGLELARKIRGELDNHEVRIVLRTGQPGQAPEESVIRDYDINDYKDKSELTKRKLSTALYAALRSYRDIMTIERSRQGLRRTIDAITRVSDSANLASFASAILEQAAYLMGNDAEGVCATHVAEYGGAVNAEPMTILAVTPKYIRLLDSPRADQLPPEVLAAFNRARETQSGFVEAHSLVSFHRTALGSESLLYMGFRSALPASDISMFEAFATNVVIAYENLVLRDKLVSHLQATAEILGECAQRASSGEGIKIDERLGALLVRHREEASLLASLRKES